MTQTTNSPNRQPRIAVFPGTFNPFTIGHAAIVRRGLQLFDRLVIAVGVNINKPESVESAEERCNEIAELYYYESRITVVIWEGLTADLARNFDAKFILRGVRSVADFEYERNIADINHTISGLETVILLAAPEYSAISSSVVRELRSFGHDVSRFIPLPPKMK